MSVFHSKAAVGAVVLIAFGAFFAGYAVLELRLGTFAQMGSGMFPMLVGVAIAGIGLVMLATEWRSVRAGKRQPSDERLVIEWRSLASVTAAMAAFSIAIPRFGIVPALVLLIAVSSFASNRLTLRAAAILAVCLSVAAYIIFVQILRLPFTMVRWPF